MDLAHGRLVIRKRFNNLQCVPVLWLISIPTKEYFREFACAKWMGFVYLIPIFERLLITKKQNLAGEGIWRAWGKNLVAHLTLLDLFQFCLLRRTGKNCRVRRRKRIMPTGKTCRAGDAITMPPTQLLRKKKNDRKSASPHVGKHRSVKEGTSGNPKQNLTRSKTALN